jgi:hypothetical protein
MELKNALLSLDKLFAKRKINYCVTGTAAFMLLGFPQISYPGDIDIKVYDMTEEQRKWLEELELLADILPVNPEYKQKSYTITVKGYKVNVIVSKEPLYDTLQLAILCGPTHGHLINVECVEKAIFEKAKLNREKDARYLLKLIKWLSSLL